MYSFITSVLLLCFSFPLVSSVPTPQAPQASQASQAPQTSQTPQASQAASTTNSTSSSSSPQVFAHYMLITRPPNGDYTNDINLAASAGIDAFAVNYGGHGVDFDTQTGYLTDFYNAVTQQNTKNPDLNFKLFISADTTSVTDPSMIVSLYNQFASSPAQFSIDGKPVLSTFSVNNPTWNWETDVVEKLSTPPFFLPDTLSTTVSGALIPASSEGLNTDITTAGAQGMVLPANAPGILTWIHPTASMEEEQTTDTAFSQAQTSSLAWMASVSPWFFKRLSADENWAHAQDDGIFIDRFSSLLALPNPPKFIELVTWNDFGESTYFGPADTSSICSQCYYDNLDHSAFLTMVKPFISAFKSSSKNITVAPGAGEVFMFYRTQPALTLGTNEASSPAGSSLGLPINATEWKDQVFVVGMLDAPAKVTLNTGGQVHSFTLQAGLSKVGFPCDFGAQSLDITFANGTVKVKDGPVPIDAQGKWYNGNVAAV